MTRARFTLVFLEAFWWWGYYLPFPFMRRLLEDWTRASAEWTRMRASDTVSLDDRESPNELLLQALTDLLNDYPVTHIKPETAPWDAIRDNLLTVRGLCGLNPAGGLRPATARRASDEEKAELARVDAFITLFIAHSRRFHDRTDPRAEELYQRTADAFTAIDDAWTGAWIVFERADMAMERGELDRSVAFVADGAGKVANLAEGTGEWDRELLANLHRTWADVSWLRGNLDEAAQAYGRAVANAYWFQGEQPNINDDGPHGPDAYTQQFYSEMTSRAAERIAQLGDRPAEADRFVSEMWPHIPHNESEGRPAVAAGTSIGAVREELFPAGPSDGDLCRVDRPFMRRWRILYQDNEDPLVGLAVLSGARVE